MAEKQPPSTDTDSGVRLSGRLLRVVDSGLGPVASARAFARARVRSQPDRESAVRRIVGDSTMLSAAAGFTHGVGGLALLPVSIPATMAGQAILNARMVAAIADTRGWDLDDPVVRQAVLVTVAGLDPRRVLAEAGIAFGMRATETAVRRIPESVAHELEHRTRTQLLARYGAKSTAMAAARVVPLVGGLAGASLDAAFTRTVAGLADRAFPHRAA